MLIPRWRSSPALCHSLGIPVIGGILVVVQLGSFLVPVFYVFVSRTVDWVAGFRKNAE